MIRHTILYANYNTSYDPLGRLTAFARGTLSASGNNGTSLDTITSPSQTQTWSLDALGNWSSVTTNGSTTTRTFNAQNQTTSVSGGTAPTYDNNGNTISDNGQTFVYDAWNRLVTALSGSTTVAAYTYDALGRRISETYSGTSTTNYLYYSPQWQVIEERQNGTGTNNVSQQYVWGAAYIDQMISRDTYTSGSISSTLFVLQDANWNVTALTDSSGNVVERYLYDPYGDVTVLNASWTPVSGNVSAFGWRYYHQSGRLDPVTGWYDFRNRDYIPSEGRWAERDPMGFGGGSTDLYVYLNDSTINNVDPFGLGPKDVAMGENPVNNNQQNFESDQDLLDYYQRVLRILMQAGGILYDEGIDGLEKQFPFITNGGKCCFKTGFSSFPGKSGKLLSSFPNRRDAVFPRNFPILSSGMLQARSFSTIGSSLTLTYTDSLNINGLIPINHIFGHYHAYINKEAFYGPTLGAVEELIHEGLHERYLLGPGHASNGMNNIVATKYQPSDVNGTAFSQYIDFLRNATLCNGKSLLDILIETAGKRPVTKNG